LCVYVMFVYVRVLRFSFFQSCHATHGVTELGKGSLGSLDSKTKSTKRNGFCKKEKRKERCYFVIPFALSVLNDPIFASVIKVPVIHPT
jgi:hypothetical protein